MSDLHAELLRVVENAITNHPRSLQKRIGPSEIGDPCARKIAYKLAGMGEVNPRRNVPWKPTVGTAVHAWLEEVFHLANKDLPTWAVGDNRYWCEVRVDVGEILGETITGSCDLFVGDPANPAIGGTVVDYKIVGDDQLRKYRSQGPGDQYRAQAHLYGRGWTRRGARVDHVAVWFFPRNQELRQNYFWTEPYDEQVAVDALTRAEGIAKLTGQLGTAAAALLPATENWCTYCTYFKPGSTDPSAGCPGVIDATTPSPSLAALIAK
ncbi:hypothetical protein [Actinomadura rugatobispora]|uniref:PD-(D/E)XK endonuclease-like domain-containing protein n=1 Tax=Actinomadura rugatobispora TaxID=1994 RepID=A0ABW0ZSY5_9ACTN|nr:hypothetical protein GCM10010200_036100 [Actinomadura rugatobispora]